jgi:hypothetical protein
MGDVVKSIVGGIIIGAVAFFTGGAGLGLLGTTTLLGSVAAGGVLGAAGGLLGVLTHPKIPNLSDEFGRELQLNGDPVAPRKICYGEARTAGTLRFHRAKGENNKDLYLVIVLVGHEIDSVQEAEFDGDTLTLDGSGNVTSPSKWAGLINVRYKLGTDDQTADSTLVAEFPGVWTTDHRLRGLPYAIVKLTFDEEELNALPQMRFRIRGRKVYDWRKDSTVAGGSGAHRIDNPATWEWSRNPILCAADFERGVKVNNRAIAGMRVAHARFDPANAIAEANVCDEDVTLAVGGTQNRYEVDGFLDPRQEQGQNLRHFEAAIAGDITFADGRWRFFAGAFRAPTLHLEDKHFIGPLTHVVHKGKSARVDAVQGIFASASDSGEVFDYPPVRLASSVAGEEDWFNMDFALVSDNARAQRCAKLLLEREAAGKRINCTTSLYGYRAVPGETINITHAAFGLSTQAMRVIDVELAMVQAGEGKMGLACNLVLEAGPSSLYAWDSEETELAAAPAIPQAQVPFFVLAFNDLVSNLINPSFETGTLDGWTQITGADWIVNSTDPHAGIFNADKPDSGAGRLRNNSSLQVTQGDRILAQGFVQTIGSGSATVRIRLNFTDSSGTFVDSAFGNSVTGLDYELSRVLKVAPAGAAEVHFEFELLNVSGRGGRFDGAYMTIVPKDIDIDVLQTTNAPAEPGADVTAPRILGNGLINPGLETGGLSGWTILEGSWSVSDSLPRSGTYHLLSNSDAAAHRIRNDSRFQVTEGDRLIAMAFVRRSGSAGAEARKVRARITWRDDAGSLLSTSEGNEISTTSYDLSRVVVAAPANAALADFEVVSSSHVGNNQTALADGCYMQIIPRGSDIILDDASGTVHTIQIDDEAVTTIASVEDDSVSMSGPGVILSLDIAAQNLDYTLVVTASLNVWVINPGAGTSEFYLRVLGNAVNLGESQRVRVSSTAAPGERIMLQVEVQITPDDEVNLSAFVNWERDSGSTTGEARSIQIRGESVKR